MNWWETVSAQAFGGVILLAIGWLAGALTSWWHARRKAALWTLEHVVRDDWTLRRDSPKTAFNLHVWSEGDAESAGTVSLPFSNERFDASHGQLIDVSGVQPGVEVIIDWVEGDRRLMARARVRESTHVVEILRKDATRYKR